MREVEALPTTVETAAVCVLVLLLIAVWAEVILPAVDTVPAEIFAAKLVEAARIVASVFPFTVVGTAAIEAPSVVEAFPTATETAEIFVLAVPTFVPIVASDEPSDDEARSVCALTADVPEVMADAREVEAVRTAESVCALTADVSDVTFAAVAKEPEVNDASVRLRVLYVHTSEAVRVEPPPVPLESAIPVVPGAVSVLVATFHTSAANVPKLVKERVPEDQTARGIVETSDEDAFKISDCIASDPELRPAPVNVRVVAPQISDAIATPDVSERVPTPQTAVATSVTNEPKSVNALLV